jgi:DNA sulfur modification protein DndB
LLKNIFPINELRTLARVKAAPYHTKSVHPKLVDEEVIAGWEIVKAGKSSVRLRRKKSLSESLEDRVWTLLYKLKFDYLSADGGGKLLLNPKDPTTTYNQLDVVGIDNELALVIECKSAEKFSKRPQFQDELAKLSEMKERASRAVNDQWPTSYKKQVAQLFFLQNINISESDKERAKLANIFLFDEQDLDYYEKLASYIGPAAKYQFFADILPGKAVSGLKIRVPCVRTKMGSYYCYTFPISPEYLLKISYVSHRSKGKASDVHTYQRMIAKSRLKKIRDYISDQGIFPTNIVVNLDKKSIKFERIHQENTQEEQESSGLLGWLDIRPAYKSAWIIDGQHRLFAYSGHDRAKTSHLSVLAFEGIPPSTQAQLFVDINAKQKSVQSSLLQELFAELNWDAESPNARVQAVISKAVQVLDSDRDSPLCARILTADASKDHIRCISLTSVFSALGKTGFYIVKEVKGNVIEYGPLWAGDNQDTLKRTVQVLKFWLDEIRKGAPDWWDLGSSEGGGLAMNDGITTCINVLRSVFTHLEEGKIKILHLDNEDLCELIKPYAQEIAFYFGSLNSEERKRFRDLRGIQGQNTRTRRCQQAIRTNIAAFNPPGLDEFINREKEQTNLKAKEVIDRIETTLQKVVIQELKQEYSEDENSWWILGIPKQVRIEVTKTAENDDNKRGTREAYFNLMDYRKIVLENWTIFQNLLGYGKKNDSKDRQTKWMVEVNEKRNAIAHASSGVSLSIEELDELENYQAWLIGKSTGNVQDDFEKEAEVSVG